ncbi:peptidyl-prolyl cis-trans isomerase-like 3 isoform X1 [Lethenteron reissneri]|uniref:peptidyl-prolyl cis-trans isomerase-like 3 isoform X1 n=1 Tax=Lethenteron reissneri TaxID=7753 RepID=UPI002AB6D074|nr:peptidyl-prolyl cis-trans isomerase-like 3 isoform X1 [Lethenteron reissneri]XP_061434786.1 peptidyl-prolyl cis-trans isomerase-like 3 isoform X1 [Lethenteron reissneri]
MLAAPSRLVGAVLTLPLNPTPQIPTLARLIHTRTVPLRFISGHCAKCVAVTLHTDLGDLKLELFCEQAPRACENFLALCASDYYNGCIFHRNIKGFMVQTGDPTGTGKGGNSIWGRKFDDEFNEHLKHNVRGVVTMANSGPNTNSSQFFITYAKQPHLDMKYTIFGKVIDGLDTLDELEKISVHEKTFRPLTDVRLKSVRIHANPLAP